MRTIAKLSLFDLHHHDVQDLAAFLNTTRKRFGKPVAIVRNNAYHLYKWAVINGLDRITVAVIKTEGVLDLNSFGNHY